MKLKYTSVAHEISFHTVKEALNLSLFPKYVKVYTSHCYYVDEHKNYPFSCIRVSLSPDEVNKGANETGMKRLRKFLEIMKKHYPDAEYSRIEFANSVALPEELWKIMMS